MIIDAPLPESGTVDMDTEIHVLQLRLNEERNERTRLKNLTVNLEAERNKAEKNNYVSNAKERVIILLKASHCV